VRDQVETVFANAAVQRAFRYISDHEAAIEADQIRLTRVPAPPFGEADRARLFAEDMTHSGFKPFIDGAGNVIAAADRLGANPVVIGAHLDTVFPAPTPLDVRRQGRRILLPGISDNGAGLVALLWLFRAIKECGLQFSRPVVAIANVGEEGEGNLRGIRHFFANPPWREHGCEFIAVDGGGMQRITHQALGSRRLRIELHGPGGHSWADFGTPNPIHALGTAIHQFVTNQTVRRPGTSFNVGIISGGISVNAIPSVAVMQVDLRSTTTAALDDLDQKLHRVVTDAARAHGVEATFKIIGERPSGMTGTDSRIVRGTIEITRKLGVDPHLDIGSTDANIPMLMGLPAIALGAGGSCGGAHTTEEWFDPSNRDVGIHRLIALTALLAGVR
jgi:tripeptide aminopeptidase